jgi:hypothetical protein
MILNYCDIMTLYESKDVLYRNVGQCDQRCLTSAVFTADSLTAFYEPVLELVLTQICKHGGFVPCCHDCLLLIAVSLRLPRGSVTSREHPKFTQRLRTS